MAGESGVLVLAEHSGGQLLGISTELLGAARRLADAAGGNVTAVCFGSGSAEVAKQALAFGADAAVVSEDAGLDEYHNDTWTASFSAAAQQVNPAIVLL